MVSFAGVHIQVRSGGCTDKKSFTVVKENLGEVQVLNFMRVSSDLCLAMLPYGTVITYSFDELGLKAEDMIQIGNIDAAVTVYKPWSRP
jgi:hypothetical protein